MITRRDLVGALSLSPLLQSIMSQSAFAQQRFDGVTLRVATFGGPWKDAIDSLVGTSLRDRGATVEYVTGEPKDSLSKAILTRGREPQFDVIEIDAGTFRPLIEGQLLASIDMNGIEHKDELVKPVYKDLLVPVYVSQEGLIYNSKKFQELGIDPPQTYSDLLNPKLRGRVAFPDINRSAAVFALIGMSIDRGGSEDNIQPGLEGVKLLGVKSFSQSTGPDATAFKAGDLWAFFAHAGWAVRLRRGGMEEASFAHLRVGDKRGVANLGYFGLVKGSKNAAIAQPFISKFISTDVQEKLARTTGIVPINATALRKLADDPILKEMMLLSPTDVKNMYSVNLDKADFAKWTEQWNRTIAK